MKKKRERLVFLVSRSYDMFFLMMVGNKETKRQILDDCFECDVQYHGKREVYESFVMTVVPLTDEEFERLSAAYTLGATNSASGIPTFGGIVRKVAEVAFHLQR